MGCLVEMTDTGQQVDVHRFVGKEAAFDYVQKARGYTFERYEPWGVTSGIWIFQGSEKQQRAAIREKTVDGKPVWQGTFWRQ